MNDLGRDIEIFDLIKAKKIDCLVCIREGYTDPQKGDSFRKGGEKHTLHKKYKITTNGFGVHIDTNFGYTIDIICGSGVSYWFETEQVANVLQRKEKLNKINEVVSGTNQLKI